MYQKRTNKKDSAVSPVVGVMLMLVVTIIIAAVVATFAGGLISNQKVTPSATINTIIDSDEKTLSMKVSSVSEPIDTAELKLVTAMIKDGKLYTATTLPGKKSYDAGPFGLGANVVGTGVFVDYKNGDKDKSTLAWNETNSGQWFGNYTLYGGVSMVVDGEYELGYILGSYASEVYSHSTTFTNAAEAEVLNTYGNYNDVNSDSAIKIEIAGIDKYFYPNSEHSAERGSGKITIFGLTPASAIVESGDIVKVTLIYTPTGQEIYSQDVRVR